MGERFLAGYPIRGKCRRPVDMPTGAEVEEMSRTPAIPPLVAFYLTATDRSAVMQSYPASASQTFRFCLVALSLTGFRDHSYGLSVASPVDDGPRVDFLQLEAASGRAIA